MLLNTHTHTHARTPLGMVVKGQIYFLKDFMIGGESHTHVGRLQDDGREGTHTHTHTHTHTLTQIYVHTNTHRATHRPHTYTSDVSHINLLL